jgi:hypothetical protein
MPTISFVSAVVNFCYSNENAKKCVCVCVWVCDVLNFWWKSVCVCECVCVWVCVCESVLYWIVGLKVWRNEEWNCWLINSLHALQHFNLLSTHTHLHTTHTLTLFLINTFTFTHTHTNRLIVKSPTLICIVVLTCIL